MRYLFVTTFPPIRCGIASYASQEVAALRAQGHLVDVMSPDDQGNVDFRRSLAGGWKILTLLPMLLFYDRIVIHYVPSFYYRGIFEDPPSWDSLRTSLAFLTLFLFGRRKVQVLIHEVPYVARAKHPSKVAFRWSWKLAPALVVHTAPEKEKLIECYGINPKRIELKLHHQDFIPFSTATREEARRELGLPADALIFLCTGFIQRHKGFDRAMAALALLGSPDALLYVVGSLRTRERDNLLYLQELRDIEAEFPQNRVLERFLSDEEFDTWIIASDWVVLPYREIWSSSVLGRAHLLHRPCLLARVGGLSSQAGSEDLLFENDDQLMACMQQAIQIFKRSLAHSEVSK